MVFPRPDGSAKYGPSGESRRKRRYLRQWPLLIAIVGGAFFGLSMVVLFHQHHNLGHSGLVQAKASQQKPKLKLNTTTSLKVQHALHMTEEEGRQYILSIMKEAKVRLDEEAISKLPTWHQVQSAVGDRPRIYGLDTCQAYQDSVPAIERMIGAAGMFNSGTNLLTKLMKNNCCIPERVAIYGPKAPREAWGMRWQVPWGKHTPARYRNAHMTEHAAKKHIDPEKILPIITIRDPYTWMKSMCKNGYSARWMHRGLLDCPRILNDDLSKNAVTVTYKKNERVVYHESVADLWNDWYNEYIVQNHQKFPFVVIRIEDLVFYTKETITAVCECAGGKIRSDQPFQYVVDSAKIDSPGHDTSTGIVEAWVKYSRPKESRAGFSDEDYEASKSILDPNLMSAFGYRHPPSD